MIQTIEAKQMNDVRKRELVAWCENEDCGEPIYSGDKHIEDVSDNGNRYFYHPQCTVKLHTPDEQFENDDEI